MEGLPRLDCHTSEPQGLGSITDFSVFCFKKKEKEKEN
jgi:hypothetical protein